MGGHGLAFVVEVIVPHFLPLSELLLSALAIVAVVFEDVPPVAVAAATVILRPDQHLRP